MPTITLKNLPDSLHRRLKERAARNRRSLNSEVLLLLEEALDSATRDAALLERVRANRAVMEQGGTWVTPELVRRATDEGRP